MRSGLLRLLLAGAIVLTAASAPAADFSIQGRRMDVRERPRKGEEGRSVLVLAFERKSDVVALPDLAASGAVLRVSLAGATVQEQLFSLPADGWTKTRNGFRWNAAAGSLPPVKTVKLVLKRNGTARLRAVLSGGVGTIALTLRPPNPGSSGGLALDVLNPYPQPGVAAQFCVRFGGVAGGTVTENSATTWRIKDATAQPGCTALPTPHWPPRPTPSAGTASPSPATPAACDKNCGGASPAG